MSVPFVSLGLIFQKRVFNLLADSITVEVEEPEEITAVLEEIDEIVGELDE